VGRWLSDDQHRTLAAALDTVLPGDAASPGAGGAGGADYVDGLLGAFTWDPPRIWAGGPFSGRHGGDAGYDRFLELGPWEAQAWRTRIAGWQRAYAAGLASLGDDFADLAHDDRADRLSGMTSGAFRDLSRLAFLACLERVERGFAAVTAADKADTGTSSIRRRASLAMPRQPSRMPPAIRPASDFPERRRAMPAVDTISKAANSTLTRRALVSEMPKIS